MARLTSLSLEDARRLAADYGLEIARLEALDAGSVNSNFRIECGDGQSYFARLYEEQDAAGAARELDLLRALSRSGVRVANPLSRAGGDLLADCAGKAFAIFPWVAGESVCLGQLAPEHCRKVGEALARVHAVAFDSQRLGPGRFGPADMLARLDRVERAAERPELLPDVRRVRELLKRYMAERDPSLAHGVVHGDLFRDNVLWSGGEIAALLDFESAFHGPLAYDVAVTLEAWCYADAFRPELVQALCSGYAAVRRFTTAEARGFATEAALACLRFATTRITDFSLRAPPGQAPKRDFRRFLARLEAIEAGALAPALDVLA